MPVARYALQYAAQLASLLGPQWRAASADSSTFAVLEGPGVEFDIRTTAPVRAHTPVTVSTRPRGDLVWSRRSDYRGEASGVIGAPGPVADEIRSHILPAWQELVTELEARTARTRAAIRHFAPLAAEITGATVSYGSRPGVADIRWEGGRAVLWASDEGLISSPSIEITSARDAATVVAVLHSATGHRTATAGPGFAVPDHMMVRLYESLDFYADAGKVTEEEYRDMRTALDAVAQMGSE
ncbi:hypothetical protein ACFFSH_31140 [Streptomyces filamentosus]|uniref:Uncharacterized protein n=1 Tax=Streptomyces filamentosus TaxID=67294 RepID=A0A919BSR8_STRFL|nr:hypothetical protein [Streptomyces filamentosus]GHG13853.1 hypothetical protein GCM10017667_54930 [Streptomyces filamentosus]